MVRLDPRSEEDRKLAFDCFQTFEGNGDWWTCHVLRLVAKADHANRAKFVLSPWEREALMYDEWVRMNPAAFSRKWGIPAQDKAQTEEWEREGRHGPEDLDEGSET